MNSLPSSFLRFSLVLIVAVCYAQTQVTPKAEAIADAGTSSGAACFAECSDVFKDCWHHVYSNPTCFDARDYCEFTCVEFGAPFKLWWLFKPKD